MIVFITLFVGLVTGIQDVHLAVSAPVTRVELRMGDRVLGEMLGEPWRLRVDLGKELRPAELTAVGYDADGRVVHRAIQRLNLPGPRAAAELVPEVEDDGRLVAATVVWHSPEFGKPKSVAARVDEETARVDRRGKVDLTRWDPKEVHVLTVDVVFPDDVQLRRELIFGSGHAGQSSHELTAVPVLVEGDEEPGVESLAGMFTAAGGVLRVAAVEKGPAQLIVLRDRSIDGAVEGLLEEKKERKSRKRSRSSRSSIAQDGFDEDVVLRVIAPVADPPGAGARPALLFPMSDEKLSHKKGVLGVLDQSRYAREALGVRRLADAVAVAGMRAAAGNRRRAVIVALGPEVEDRSRFSIEVVRAYLDDLGVPLHVWKLGGGEQSAAGRWGEVERLETFRQVRGAVRRIRDELAAQRTVWVEGRFLPQEVELNGSASGVRLVGRK